MAKTKSNRQKTKAIRIGARDLLWDYARLARMYAYEIVGIAAVLVVLSVVLAVAGVLAVGSCYGFLGMKADKNSVSDKKESGIPFRLSSIIAMPMLWKIFSSMPRHKYSCFIRWSQ